MSDVEVLVHGLITTCKIHYPNGSTSQFLVLVIVDDREKIFKHRFSEWVRWPFGVVFPLFQPTLLDTMDLFIGVWFVDLHKLLESHSPSMNMEATRECDIRFY